MDRVSVIIPVYNGKLFLNALVDSILVNTLHKDYEVIFIDDKSEKEDMSNVYTKIEQHDHFKIIYNTENLGFAKTNNVGFKHATGEFIYLLNSDTLVKKGWLLESVKMFRKSKLYFGKIPIGAIQSKIILPSENANTQEKVQTCGSLFSKEGIPIYRYPNTFTDSTEANTISIVHSFMGCGVLIDKKLIDSVGGFDENFGKYYFEDSDLSLRISALGFSVVYNPFSEIVHFHGMTTSLYIDNTEILDYNTEKSRSYFKKKWPVTRIIEVLN